MRFQVLSFSVLSSFLDTIVNEKRQCFKLFLKNFNQFTSSRILCVIIVYRFCFPHYFTMYSIIDRDSSCPVGRLSQGKLKSKVEVEKLKSFLEKLEHPKQAFLFKMQMIVTVGVILFGFALGVLQKWIDGSPSNIFPIVDTTTRS